MRIFHRRPSLLIFAGVVALSNGCVTAGAQLTEHSSQKPVAEQTAKSVTIDLPPQTLFSAIGFNYKGSDASKEARKIFQSQALPMAAEYGFTRHGTLFVTAVNAGKFKPQGFLLTSWPNQAAFDNFQKDPKWPGFDALRPQIWNDIRYYRDVQENGLKLTLKSDKFYTLAIAYTKSGNPGDYKKYLASLEDEVSKNGGKFVLKLDAPKLESLSGKPSPDQLTFIEWNDADGVDRLFRSEAYKANRHLAASGTTELAFYRLKPSI